MYLKITHPDADNTFYLRLSSLLAKKIKKTYENCLPIMLDIIEKEFDIKLTENIEAGTNEFVYINKLDDLILILTNIYLHKKEKDPDYMGCFRLYYTSKLPTIEKQKLAQNTIIYIDVKTARGQDFISFHNINNKSIEYTISRTNNVYKIVLSSPEKNTYFCIKPIEDAIAHTIAVDVYKLKTSYTINLK